MRLKLRVKSYAVIKIHLNISGGKYNHAFSSLWILTLFLPYVKLGGQGIHAVVIGDNQIKFASSLLQAWEVGKSVGLHSVSIIVNYKRTI